MFHRLRRPLLLRVALFVIMLLLGGYIAVSIDIYIYGSVSDTRPADAAIVLGAAAWDNQPSPVFAERIKHAIDLYHGKQVKVIIFTGGTGPTEPMAESIVARDYALRYSVAPQAILYETRSTDTLGNLCEAREIMEREHLGRVLIVSDPLHLRRAITLARDMGLEAYPSPTPTSRYTRLASQLGFTANEARLYSTYLLGKFFAGKAAQCSPSRT